MEHENTTIDLLSPRKRGRSESDTNLNQSTANCDDSAIGHLLARSVEKQRRLKEDHDELIKKLQAIEDLCLKKDQQIQSEKLIIKFRDNMIDKLRMQLDSAHPNIHLMDEEKVIY